MSGSGAHRRCPARRRAPRPGHLLDQRRRPRLVEGKEAPADAPGTSTRTPPLPEHTAAPRSVRPCSTANASPWPRMRCTATVAADALRGGPGRGPVDGAASRRVRRRAPPLRARCGRDVGQLQRRAGAEADTAGTSRRRRSRAPRRGATANPASASIRMASSNPTIGPARRCHQRRRTGRRGTTVRRPAPVIGGEGRAAAGDETVDGMPRVEAPGPAGATAPPMTRWRSPPPRLTTNGRVGPRPRRTAPAGCGSNARHPRPATRPARGRRRRRRSGEELAASPPAVLSRSRVRSRGSRCRPAPARGPTARPHRGSAGRRPPARPHPWPRAATPPDVVMTPIPAMIVGAARLGSGRSVGRCRRARRRRRHRSRRAR